MRHLVCRAQLRRAAFRGSARRSRALQLAIAAVLLASAANACPVCFGGESSISKGMDSAIFFLLSIVGLVQLGFVALFWSFWRRAKELRRKRESFRLIEGGAR